jgi:hypothetical protein
MDIPENLDAFLINLLEHSSDEDPAPQVELDDDDRAFVERIMESVAAGSKGIFIVLHPNEQLQYMLLNTKGAGALVLLATVMQRHAETLAADVD